MSDKNKISMEDRGWSQMSSLLDRELPQEKSKKRSVFWFFVLGVLILASAFAISINDNGLVQESKTTPLIAQQNNVVPSKKSSDIQNSSLKETPAEETQIVNRNQVDESDLQPAENNLSVAPKDQSGSDDSEVMEAIRMKDQQTKREISVVSEKISVPYTSNRTDILNTIESNTTPINIDVTSHNPKQSDGYLTDLKSNEKHIQNPKSSIIRQRVNYNHLPTGIHMVEKEQDFLADLSVVTSVQNGTSSNNQTDNFKNNYVFVSGLAGLNSKGKGFQFGLGRKFGDRNFNFYTEAGYARMGYSSGESNARSVNVEINESEFSVNEVLSEDNKASVLKTIQNNRVNGESIDKLNNVFISAGINKSLSDKFIITGGITYSKFLSIENQELNFVSNNATIQADLDQYNISSNFLFENGEFKKYEFSTRIGFGYQITPRMTLSANYIHGLTDIININNANNSLSDLMTNEPAGELRSSFRSSIFRKNAELRIDYSF